VQFVTISVTNPALFASLPVIDSNGLLSFRPAADANGFSLVTVAAQDDGTPGNNFSGTQTFIITVKPVNDPPSFTSGPDIQTTDESGDQIVPGWATNVTAGPPDESGGVGISGMTVVAGGEVQPPAQQLTFNVTTQTPGLFSSPPAIDATGQLTFTPKPNVHGQATLSVALMDDGGTADGGKDTSFPQTFHIEIDKPRLWRNAIARLDVNDDGHVAANDALAVIDYISAFGALNAGQVPAAGTIVGGFSVDSGQPFGFLDTTGDNFVTPNDALDVINAINAGQGGEGSGFGVQGSGIPWSQGSAVGSRGCLRADDVLALLAVDIAGQGVPRRRENVK
jgi:hypothetical protein